MVGIFLISTPRNIAYIITSDPETGQSESENASVVESEDITFTFRINSGNIKSSANQRGDQSYSGTGDSFETQHSAGRRNSKD